MLTITSPGSEQKYFPPDKILSQIGKVFINGFYTDEEAELTTLEFTSMAFFWNFFEVCLHI